MLWGFYAYACRSVVFNAAPGNAFAAYYPPVAPNAPEQNIIEGDYKVNDPPSGKE